MYNPQDIAQKFITELKMGSLSPEEQQQVLGQVAEHFNDIIERTTITMMSSEQFEQYKQARRNEDYDAIALISAQIPGLAEVLDRTIADEYETMKAVLAT